MERAWLAIGTVCCGLSVALGAFAAHGLDGFFAKKYAGAEPRSVAGMEVPRAVKYLDDFKTGARYQMYHGLGILAVGILLPSSGRPRALKAAAWCFLLGNILFAGGLYVYTISGLRIVGMIPPPIGGTLFIIGWICFTAGVLAPTPAESASL
jgi:uncharacterized membrane protein YgdD (TMEM256/DUF423 family)